jgi:ActR/RegA family two-component response regulator
MRGNGRGTTSNKPTILLVDDATSAHRVLVPLFTAEGFDVVSAFDVSEALAELRSRAIDGVVADLHLGSGAGGDTLLAAVEQWHPRVRALLLLTADPQGPVIAELVGAVWIDRAGDPAGMIVDALRALLDPR